MARKKDNTAADLVDLVALLPWWMGCAVALITYAVLHRVASQEALTSSNPAEIGAVITQSIWRAFALVGQYLLPLLFLTGAAISAYGRHHRKNLVAAVSDSSAFDVLDGIAWRDFELLVGEAFRLKGFQVTEHGGSEPDGGVDLVLRKDNEKFLVQCKHWKAFSVGVGVVRELYGVMAATSATGGFVVTSGRFTVEAKAFARGRNVTLMDGPALREMITQARRAHGVGAKPEGAPSAVLQTAAEHPQCPTCNKPMVKRMARRATGGDNSFWGCSAFPLCRGTRGITSLK